jgi:hypothetical protein
MDADQFREWASEIDPKLRLAWHNTNHIEIRLYREVNKKSWDQEGVCHSKPELWAWLRGYSRGRRRR